MVTLGVVAGPAGAAVGAQRPAGTGATHDEEDVAEEARAEEDPAVGIQGSGTHARRAPAEEADPVIGVIEDEEAEGQAAVDEKVVGAVVGVLAKGGVELGSGVVGDLLLPLFCSKSAKFGVSRCAMALEAKVPQGAAGA